MIYLDTSVALAHLLAKDRRPPDDLRQESLVSSRLLQFELWTRLTERSLGRSHREAAADLESRISFLELVPPVLQRALEPFPMPVRTLDAPHLASADFLRGQSPSLKLATYDDRLLRAAVAVGIEAWSP